MNIEFDNWMKSTGTKHSQNRTIEYNGIVFEYEPLQTALLEFNEKLNEFSIGHICGCMSGPNNPLTASHIITNVSIVDDTIKVEYKALDTPIGLMLQEFINSGWEIKFSIQHTTLHNLYTNTKQYRISAIDIILD